MECLGRSRRCGFVGTTVGGLWDFICPDPASLSPLSSLRFLLWAKGYIPFDFLGSIGRKCLLTPLSAWNPLAFHYLHCYYKNFARHSKSFIVSHTESFTSPQSPNFSASYTALYHTPPVLSKAFWHKWTSAFSTLEPLISLTQQCCECALQAVSPVSSTHHWC